MIVAGADGDFCAMLLAWSARQWCSFPLKIAEDFSCHLKLAALSNRKVLTCEMTCEMNRWSGCVLLPQFLIRLKLSNKMVHALDTCVSVCECVGHRYGYGSDPSRAAVNQPRN